MSEMSESLYNIFGDQLLRKSIKNVPRQPISNVENMGKMVSSGPFKLNEPMKKPSEPKKSFLSNTGKALQSTPLRQAFTPRAINMGSLIYKDEQEQEKEKNVTFEEIEFNKPRNKYDNYYKDVIDFLPFSEPEILQSFSPPSTPPPNVKRPTMEFDCSYEDEFFTDDFADFNFPGDEDLGLPEIY